VILFTSVTLPGDAAQTAANVASDPQLENYVLRLLDECRDEVKLADTKTNILFGAVAAVIALLMNILLDDTSELRTSGDAVVVLSVIVLAMFTAALVFLALAVTPRLGRPQPGQARYFQEHAQFTEPGALLELIARDAEQPVVRHVQQLHALARIVRRKYQLLRRAMQTISLAMVVLAVVALVGAAQ
jgi:hypothetical protein